MMWEEAGLIVDDPELKSLLYSLASRNVHVDGLQAVKEQFEHNKQRRLLGFIVPEPTIQDWLNAIRFELPLRPKDAK